MNSFKPPPNCLEARGLHVSRLGFGSAPIGNLYGAVPEETAIETVRAAIKGGVNLLDTAPTYGAGSSETRLGKALRGVPREQYMLESKVGRVLENGALHFDFSPAGLERSLEGSLERLGVEALDLVLLHDPDDFEREVVELAVPTLLEWRSAGRVGAIGVGMNQWQMPLRFIEQFDLDIVMVAGRYTLLEQGALPLLDMCAAQGVTVFVGGVFNSGVLASGVRAGAKHDYAPASPEVLTRVAALEGVCARHGVALNAAAIQFVLAHPGVTSAVLGASSPDEVRANFEASRTPIPPDFWLELRALALLPPDVPLPSEIPFPTPSVPRPDEARAKERP